MARCFLRIWLIILLVIFHGASLFAQTIRPGTSATQEMIPSRKMSAAGLFNHLPPDPDANSGTFLSAADIKILFSGMLADEAGYFFDKEYLRYYREDGYFYTVDKGFFLAAQPNSGVSAGKWFIKDDQLCNAPIGGDLICERIRQTNQGKIIKVRFDQAGGRPSYLITPTFSRSIFVIQDEALAAVERGIAWRDMVQSELKRMWEPKPNTCRMRIRGELVPVPC